jgi:uncharacterized protein (DUF433 family)
MTIPDELKETITTHDQILGGTPCFKGTRVPLATFLDHVETGYSLDQFLKGYSSVSRDQASLVLEWTIKQGRQTMGLDHAS